MVTRFLLAMLTSALLAGCATVDMSGDEAVERTAEALADAGLVVTDIALVDDADPGAHEVDVRSESGSLTLIMDAGSGRFTSIAIGENADIGERQVDALARTAGNPADDRARRGRAVVVSAVLLGAVALVLVLARRARLREEALAP